MSLIESIYPINYTDDMINSFCDACPANWSAILYITDVCAKLVYHFEDTYLDWRFGFVFNKFYSSWLK